jgi:integrase
VHASDGEGSPARHPRGVLAGLEKRGCDGTRPRRRVALAYVEAGIPAPVKTRWLRIYLHRAATAVGLGAFAPRADGAKEKDGETPKLEHSELTLGQLRHLALKLALDGGATLADVRAHARHRDPKMTMRYLKRAGRKAAAAAIGRELEGKPKAAGEGK